MKDKGKSPMDAAPALPSTPEPDVERLSVKAQIAAFLDGQTHGEGLLHALYDAVLEEPIPPQMRALLSG